ncbi:hypothetical protein ACN3XK_42940 [Actinomadura welshii]
MKFELIEFTAEDVPEWGPEQPEEEFLGDAGTDGDPVVAIGAAAARLTADARAAGERIGASLAEIAAVVRDSAPRTQGARPPGNFRAGRFSKGDAR